MKKKFLSVLLAICMAIPCFFLNACGGGKDNSMDYLTFTLLEDGTYSVALKDRYRVIRKEDGVGIIDGENRFDLRDTIIKIPSTYEGKAVTQIADFAFYSSCIKGVEIPSGVTYIGVEAFAGSNNLQAVSLPDTVKIIAPQAFDHIVEPGDKRAVLEYIVVPSSVEYLADYTFDFDVTLYYKGSAEQFSTIKSILRRENELTYTDSPYVPHSEQEWFVYDNDISDITAHFSADKTVKGVWKYNAKQEIESVAIEYGNTVNGKTYEYVNSDVSITDQGWQILGEAYEQGMLGMLLTPEEMEMFISSSSKEEYAQKCEAYNVAALTDMRVVFANGQFTLWQNGAQYSYPLDYVEVNGTIYYQLRGAYVVAYAIDGDKIVESVSTEYSGVKHYYTEQAQ